jgi:hypothetical protein
MLIMVLVVAARSMPRCMPPSNSTHCTHCGRHDLARDRVPRGEGSVVREEQLRGGVSLEVVLVLLVGVLAAQQVVQRELGQRQRLVQRVQVVGVDGGHQVTQQPDPPGVGKCLALALQHLLFLSDKIVDFRYERCGTLHLAARKTNDIDAVIFKLLTITTIQYYKSYIFHPLCLSNIVSTCEER